MLLGSTRSRSLLRRMKTLGWGRLFVAEEPKPIAGEAWALDNGVFGAWKSERSWDEQAFIYGLNRAERAISVGRIASPLFAVLPDVVASAESLHFSLDWHNRIGRLFNVPWFLVLQNGMRREDVVTVLRDGIVKGLFLGGDDEFKRSAPMWCALAHEQRVRFHYARVSTVSRLQEAWSIGADSCDTTQPLWSEESFDRFDRAWCELRDRGVAA